ncbi:GNAT family N-acetyltransferase [Pseudonocardia endophytica]|uniref:N-acetyltransferase domain-containing protein n=1 Tax=Pseudonocardia endophytica TaxID=401976 RepID=A0A4R1I9S3_PSEEN|nr:GNAT family N-acetyltransferase [Pseudonocardia endophytica]TCK27032.1 hypothetical protein EV378_2886 [Pseudonocardia endophytica]
MADEPTVVDTGDRYELRLGDEVAGFAEYRRRGDTTSFTHTLVEQQYGGRGFGSILIRGALDAERAAGRAVKPYCPFVRGYIDKHPEFADLVAAGFHPDSGETS